MFPVTQPTNHQTLTPDCSHSIDDTRDIQFNKVLSFRRNNKENIKQLELENLSGNHRKTLGYINKHPSNGIKVRLVKETIFFKIVTDANNRLQMQTIQILFNSPMRYLCFV